MPQFKNLLLSREKIDDTIKNIDKSCIGPSLVGQNKEIHYKFSSAKDGSFDTTIVIFYKLDGTTTISPRGKNIEYGKLVATQIMEKCTLNALKNVNIKNGTLVINEIKPEDFLDCLEYLEKVCNATKISQEESKDGCIYQYTGVYGDKVTITHYNKNQSKVMVQGIPLLLYHNLIEALSEVLPYEDIVKAQFNRLNIDCNIHEIRNDLKTYLHSGYYFLDEKTRAIMSPSLVLHSLDIQLEDYTAFAFPALKGLESFIKLIFIKNGILFKRDQDSFGSYFNCANNNVTLVPHIETNITNTNIKKALINSYSYLRENRHSLFHVNADPSSTRIINFSEAASICNDVYRVIRENHALLLL